MISMTQEERNALLGQTIAMQICIRSLVVSHPAMDVFKQVLPVAREESMAFLDYQARTHGQAADIASVALYVDHLLYVLTSGMFGEHPGPPG